MRGATSSTRGREISSPPGESISRLAEIESLGEGNIMKGRFHFGSPACIKSSDILWNFYTAKLITLLHW